MRRTIFWRLALAVCIAAFASPACATYSGLVIIPTAETVGDGQYAVELQVDGPISDTQTDLWYLNTQFGLGDRFEAGVDFEWSKDDKSRVLWNAKYLPYTWERGAFAVGTFSIGPRADETPHAVVTQDLGPLRAHLGAIRTEGHGRWFTGFDKAVGDHLTVMADYTNGRENFSSVGLSYCPNGRFEILAGVYFPNDSDERTGFSLHLVFGGQYCRTTRHN